MPQISLPPEIWALIVPLVVRKRTVAEQWIVRRGDAEDREWRPLRALTQVNRCLRALAMEQMWRVVRLRPIQDDFAVIGNLRQLADELPHGGNKYLEELDIALPRSRFEDTSEGEYSPDESKLFEDACPGGIATRGFWEEDAFGALIRLLSRQLRDCPRLTSIRWTGWLCQIIESLHNLSWCPNLQRVELRLPWVDTGRYTPYWHIDDAEAVATPISKTPFQSLRTVEVGLDVPCPSHEKYRGSWHGSHWNCEEETLQVDYFVRCNALPSTTFIVGMPDLIHPPWMAAVWANVENIVWASSDGRCRWHQDYMSSAQAFRGILKRHVKLFEEDESAGTDMEGRKPTDPVPLSTAVIAKSIEDVVFSHDELRAFRMGFGIEIAKSVARVLLADKRLQPGTKDVQN